MKNLNILLANDDGIDARGLRELADALRNSGRAKIYVCAPQGQMSATGHGITLGKKIHIQEIQYPGAEMAFAIGGTPADCVKVGLKLLRNLGIKIDMVYSGINHGGNLGTDTLYSGTVSAAMEGVVNGVPSVAVSVDSHSAEHFQLPCELAVEVLKKGASEMGGDVMLNINVPNIPKEEVAGVRVARLGPRDYEENFIKIEDENLPKGEYYVSYGGDPIIYDDLPEDMDTVAIQDRCAVITPLQKDLTCTNMIDTVKEWGIER